VRRSRPRLRPTTGTRSRPAAGGSSARSTCASTRCSREIKSQEQLEAEFANKSRFEKMRSAHYEPEHNFAFIDHIVGGTIPTQFLPAVEKGCKELLDRGALAGYRMQDVAVEVHFGKYHDVDSSEAAFKNGRPAGLQEGDAGGPAGADGPIVDLEVTVPTKYTGAILGDLNVKRARVDNQDSLPGDLALIHAKAPLAEVMKYAAQLGSITQGQGAYSMSFSHYEQVPGNVQQQIVSRRRCTRRMRSSRSSEMGLESPPVATGGLSFCGCDAWTFSCSCRHWTCVRS